MHASIFRNQETHFRTKLHVFLQSEGCPLSLKILTNLSDLVCDLICEDFQVRYQLVIVSTKLEYV